MQYPKRNFFSNQSAKLIAFCIILLAYTGHAVAQKKDTIPAKRIGDVKTIITNRVLTTPPKDTVKPVDKRINNDNRIIKDVNIFRDTLKDKIVIQTRFPDTLNIGAYSIVVEAYDKGGTWDNNLKRYNSLDGTGYIKFNCPTSFVIWPGIWKGAILKPISYKVVNIKTKEDEISTQDVAALGLKAQPGEDVELMMPIINGRAIDFGKYITDLKAPKKFEGIRVRFTNISASVTKAGATTGVVVSGSAAYPTDPATPPVPLMLSVASGFQLEISGIVFSPGVDPMVTAQLVLPSSLTQNSECAAGRLDLGSFRLGSSCEFYKVLAGSNYGVFGVGNTTLAIQGQGYVVDFSSSQSYPASGKPATWKGVVLMQGESKGTTTSDVISNIGYLQAPYAFANGIIESTGLTANFTTTASYGYGTTQPYGYTIEFSSASVNVAASAIAGGSIPTAKITLPATAVRQGNNSVVTLSDANLAIKPSMDLVGYAIVNPAQNLYWGDLIAAGGGDRKSFGVADIDRQAWIFFSARPRPMFSPTTPSGKKFNAPFATLNPTILETFNMQGATFGKFTYLVVNTPDMPSSWDPLAVRTPATDNRVWYRLNKKRFLLDQRSDRRCAL